MTTPFAPQLRRIHPGLVCHHTGHRRVEVMADVHTLRLCFGHRLDVDRLPHTTDGRCATRLHSSGGVSERSRDVIVPKDSRSDEICNKIYLVGRDPWNELYQWVRLAVLGKRKEQKTPRSPPAPPSSHVRTAHVPRCHVPPPAPLHTDFIEMREPPLHTARSTAVTIAVTLYTPQCTMCAFSFSDLTLIKVLHR